MIDKKYLSEIIADEYDVSRLINEDDVITEDVITILSRRQSRFMKCFVPCKDKNTHLFKIKLPCEKCGKLSLKECSKTKLQEYCFGGKRRDKAQFVCDKCQKEEEAEKERQRAISAAEREKAKEQASDDYISSLLDPEKSWKSETKQDMKEYWVERFYQVNDEDIRDYILSMEYSDFLQTPYWKAIAGKIRRKAGYKCQICGEKKALSVHHRSYELHGLEHTYAGQRDLIAICQDCHDKFHFEQRVRNRRTL